MDDANVFPTKFGNVFWAIIAMIGVVAVVFYIIFRGEFVYTLPMFFVIILLIVLTAHGTKYIFDKDRLVIKCPLTFSEPPAVPYSSIKKIEDKNLWKYSLGFSSDSVFIYHGTDGFVAVSPKDKQEFIRMLRARCPKAKFEAGNESGKE
jgi:hypothetical protein